MSLNRTPTQVYKDLENLIQGLNVKYPTARLCYSEILKTESQDINNSVTCVNQEMASLCETHDRLTYAQNTALQSDNKHFEDAVHINAESGTRLFVADITRAIRAADVPPLITTRHAARTPDPQPPPPSHPPTYGWTLNSRRTLAAGRTPNQRQQYPALPNPQQINKGYSAPPRCPPPATVPGRQISSTQPPSLSSHHGLHAKTPLLKCGTDLLRVEATDLLSATAIPPCQAEICHSRILT